MDLKLCLYLKNYLSDYYKVFNFEYSNSGTIEPGFFTETQIIVKL